MASQDFIEDAIDSLQKSDQAHVMVAGFGVGHRTVHQSAGCANRATLEWLKRQAARVFAKMEKDLEERGL